MNIASVASNIPSPRPEWIERFARFGLIAKGVVYCLVGILAFMAAFELGGNRQNAGKTGVFQFILEQPFGTILLALVAAGMLCYALWRFIQAIKDTEDKGTDTKGIGKRIGYAFSGFVYGTLAFYAFKLLMGNSSGSNGDSRQKMASTLLSQPFGQWLLGAVALGTIAVGIHQIYRALSGKYKKNVQGMHLKPEIEKTLIKAGKVGYIARGVVWMIIGYLFLKAATEANSSEAGGSKRAFQFLEEASYGSYLLGAVALGLICYGIFMFVRAKYQNIGTPAN
ncbi:DUF1206 domain-containing protein [Pontibacter vulgaris]|uniref:DUF1206 domain-containing protein n=1 Tax=Pontibacter vulgaris TaxID=2905679 RepID=UPI001FA6FDB8|nr:DUF1206 domain-containing protein [Pontibacter vulgaris]